MYSRRRQRRLVKAATLWVAFLLVSVAAVVSATVLGAELAGVDTNVGWTLAKLAGVLSGLIVLVVALCAMIEDA